MLFKKPKKENKIFKCPRCGFVINFVGEPSEKITIQCPNCSQKGFILFKKKNWEKRFLVISKIIGVIQILIGIYFLLIQTPKLEKVGITLIIIGVTIIFLITEKTFYNSVNDNYIILGTIMLILVFFFVTGKSNLELFVVMIFIGLLIIKEVTEEYTSVLFKRRMGILFLAFFLIFLAIVGKRIITILHI